MSTVDELVEAHRRARARVEAATIAERQLLGQAIAALDGQGRSIRQIAARLDVSKSTVHRILVAAQRSKPQPPAGPRATRTSGRTRVVQAPGTNPPTGTPDRTPPTRPARPAQRGGRAGGNRGPTRTASPADHAGRDAGAPSRPTPARRRAGERWFVVETKPAHQDDLDRAVVIMSAHSSKAGAVRGRARLWRRGPPAGVVYVVRPEDQIRWRLEWDPEQGRGVTREGPPPPRR